MGITQYPVKIAAGQQQEVEEKVKALTKRGECDLTRKIK